MGLSGIGALRVRKLPERGGVRVLTKSFSENQRGLIKHAREVGKRRFRVFYANARAELVRWGDIENPSYSKPVLSLESANPLGVDASF
jgi:hypothetical protein